MLAAHGLRQKSQSMLRHKIFENFSSKSNFSIIPAGWAGFLEEVDQRFSTLDYERRLDATSWSNKLKLSYDRYELARVRWMKDKTRLIEKHPIYRGNTAISWILLLIYRRQRNHSQVIVLINKYFIGFRKPSFLLSISFQQ